MADYAEGPFERVVGVGWANLGAATGMFAVDGAPTLGSEYEIRFREHASALIASTPSYTLFAPVTIFGADDPDGQYYAASDVPHPSGTLVQTFTAGSSASVCNGGGSVTLTEGGELTVSRAGLSLPVRDFRYVERSITTPRDLYSIETCSGSGADGRWMQVTGHGLEISAGIAWTSLSRSIANLPVRNFLGAGASSAIGRAALQGSAVSEQITGHEDGVVYRQSVGSQSTAFVILWHLIPGTFAGSVNGRDWYHHALHEGHVVFAWPLATTGFATEVWMSNNVPGQGLDAFGDINRQSGVSYRLFQFGV